MPGVWRVFFIVRWFVAMGLRVSVAEVAQKKSDGDGAGKASEDIYGDLRVTGLARFRRDGPGSWHLTYFDRV